MTSISFPARLHAARATSSATAADRANPTGAVLAFLRHVGRRLADAPLDSPVLRACPAPRTRARLADRTATLEAVGSAHAERGARLLLSWTPTVGRDGKVHLVAHWSRPR